MQLREAGNPNRTSVRGILERCLASLREGGDLPAQAREALEEKLASNAFNLVAVGQFKRGKTSVINALIGEELLPVGVVPLTSIVTVLAYGERLTIEVRYDDGRRERISRERLPEFVTETGNPRNEKRVSEVAIAYPSAWLKAGVRLVDTPGIGSVYEHNTDVAQRYLPKADAVLFLLSVEQPASQAERDYLKEVARLASRVFVLVNKADLVSEAELREALEFTRRALADVLGAGVRLFPVSARLAVEARARGSEDLLQRSGFPPFFGTLRAFLSSGKEEAFLVSVARNVLRLVAQARFERALELKAVSAPLEELEQKLQRFQARRQELLAARDEHVVIVKAEQKKLLREVVEIDLEAFEAQLVRDIAARVERQFEERRSLPARKLAETLHQQAVEEIRRRFDAWRAAEDEKVSSAFQATCERVAARLDAAVDELYRFAADLFAVPYEAIHAETLWSEDARFHYKFWEEPGSLYLLASSAVLALPRLIGDRMILRRAREAAIDAARTQSGRVRYDFQQRLERSAAAFETRMLANVATVLQGLDRALTDGAAMQRSGEAQAGPRRQSIQASLGRLERVRSGLESIAGGRTWS
ncbi:MAG: dynamin [Betaproteobacteria bacterium]|nr:MAG: dynamin [Betaproteobacteria bacterium]